MTMRPGWWRIPRRTLLRGLGTGVALPFLEVMAPSGARARAAASTPKRAVFIWALPCSVVAKGDAEQQTLVAPWTPKDTGPLKDAGDPFLKPFFDRRIQSKTTILTGVTDRSGGGHHGFACGGFLGSTRPAHEADSFPVIDIKGPSADQIAANHLRQFTPDIPSLALGTSPKYDPSLGPYHVNISWKSGTQPVPRDINPRPVFDRLFGTYDPAESKAAAMKRQLYRKSVIDAVQQDARALLLRLGKADQEKLGQYVDSVRDLENRLDRTGPVACGIAGLAPEDQPMEKLSGSGFYSDRNLENRVKIMIDLIVAALACDRTRIATFMMVNAYGQLSMPHLGVSEQWHHISHYDQGYTAEEQARNVKWMNDYCVWAITMYADLMAKLDAVTEADGSTVLDNTVLYFSGENTDGTTHHAVSMPIILGGRGGAGSSGAWNIKAGRHIRFPGWPGGAPSQGEINSHYPYEPGGPRLDLQAREPNPLPLNPGEVQARDVLWGILRMLDVPNVNAFGDATGPLSLA